MLACRQASVLERVHPACWQSRLQVQRANEQRISIQGGREGGGGRFFYPHFLPMPSPSSTFCSHGTHRASRIHARAQERGCHPVDALHTAAEDGRPCSSLCAPSGTCTPQSAMEKCCRAIKRHTHTHTHARAHTETQAKKSKRASMAIEVSSVMHCRHHTNCSHPHHRERQTASPARVLVAENFALCTALFNGVGVKEQQALVESHNHSLHTRQLQTARTHAHPHTRAHAHAYTHTHMDTHAHTRTHACTQQ